MKPTKEQLKECFEASQKKEDGLLVNAFYRRISIILTKYIARINIRPEVIVITSFIIGILGVISIATGNRLYLIIGGLLVIFSQILDSVDGEIARLKNLVSKGGGWLDAVLDRVLEGPLLFCVALGLYNQTQNPFVWVYAFIAIFSIYITNIITMYCGTKLEKTTLKESHSKFFLIRILRRLGIKQQYLTLGVDVHTFIVAIGAILNQLMLVLWFFVIIQNIYWIAIVILVAWRNVTLVNPKKEKK